MANVKARINIPVSEIEGSIKDDNPEIDTHFMSPHFTPDWESEISDDELELIMKENENGKGKHVETTKNENREKAIAAYAADNRRKLKL